MTAETFCVGGNNEDGILEEERLVGQGDEVRCWFWV